MSRIKQQEILAYIINNSALLGVWEAGLKALHESQVLDFLKEKASSYPSIIGMDNNSAALTAAFKAGQSELLDDLINFKAKYIVSELAKNNLVAKPTYGAEAIIKEQGVYTEGELNEYAKRRA